MKAEQHDNLAPMEGVLSTVESSTILRSVQQVESHSKPRICMPTARAFTRNAFRAGLYEAQDVLAETGDADLVNLETEEQLSIRRYWLRKLLYHDVFKKVAFLNPGLKSVRLERDYDLFLAVCQFVWELPYFNAVKDWKRHCKTSVCVIDELWAATIPRFGHLWPALNLFDHVFVGQSSSVAPLSEALGRVVHWLPGGVDTLRFSPYPKCPARVVDVYSVGRRADGIHRSLLREASTGNLFYLYDTFPAADTDVYDPTQHRSLFANIAKRSKFFMVAPGKVNDAVRQNQTEIGYRYYEGAASGAVMLGQAPDCATFKEMFPWKDAVIDIPSDGSATIETVNALLHEPERLTEISRRNATESLLRFDWIYRWKQVLSIAGLEPSEGMLLRERTLSQLESLASRSPQNRGTDRY